MPATYSRWRSGKASCKFYLWNLFFGIKNFQKISFEIFNLNLGMFFPAADHRTQLEERAGRGHASSDQGSSGYFVATGSRSASVFGEQDRSDTVGCLHPVVSSCLARFLHLVDCHRAWDISPSTESNRWRSRESTNQPLEGILPSRHKSRKV